MPETASQTHDAVLFRERLWPSWWIWFFCLCVSAASMIVFLPINPTLGVVVFAIFAGLTILFLVRSAALIEITEDVLQVGNAQIERKYLSNGEGFVRDAARVARGPELNALSYQCIRGWIDPVVRVDLNDPQDPTPYWIFSTRRPAQLLEALNAVD